MINSNFKLKIKPHKELWQPDSEKGVSLIITLFIMIIVLAVILSISSLLYSEVKVIKNIGNSMVSFYVADSGIEKVLYYDRKILLTMSTGVFCESVDDCDVGQICEDNVCKKFAPRGLCSLYAPLPNNPEACIPDPAPKNPNTEHGIYCSDVSSPLAGGTPPGDGCDYDICSDCNISFKTSFDSDGKIYYTISARVYPDGAGSGLEIKSEGFFGGTGRQIKTTIIPTP